MNAGGGRGATNEFLIRRAFLDTSVRMHDSCVRLDVAFELLVRLFVCFSVWADLAPVML